MPSACFAPLLPLRLPSLKLTLSTFLPILSPFMLSLSSHPSHSPLPRLLSCLTALRSLLPPLPAGTQRPHPSQPPHPSVSAATPNTPQTPPKHTPRRLKSFLEKTLTARETPAQRPSNTPGAPAPFPGPSARPRPHAQGTCQPIPVAPMGRPTLPLAPPSARSSQASEAWEPAKNPPKPSLASPSPLGTGWRETVPPSPPRSAAGRSSPSAVR